MKNVATKANRYSCVSLRKSGSTTITAAATRVAARPTRNLRVIKRASRRFGPSRPGRAEDEHEQQEGERDRQAQVGRDLAGEVGAEKVDRDAERSPPITAPTGLSSPPRIAAANA
mgnify:CR=1 FL=1